MESQLPPSLNRIQQPPDWADGVIIDGALNQYHRPVGDVQPCDERGFTVELVQFEEVDLTTEPVTVTRLEPQLRINGCRYARDQAATLAELITTGLGMLDEHR